MTSDLFCRIHNTSARQYFHRSYSLYLIVLFANSTETRDRRILVYQSLSLVSTLAGGTIATLLQMTYDKESRSATIANTLLFVSLLLSLATAILCQFANYSLIANRPPASQLPWYERLGEKATRDFPLVASIGAVATLFGGAIAFAYTLFPGTHIPALTSSITALIFAAFIVSLMCTFPKIPRLFVLGVCRAPTSSRRLLQRSVRFTYRHMCLVRRRRPIPDIEAQLVPLV